jgi:hypothetical protein
MKRSLRIAGIMVLAAIGLAVRCWMDRFDTVDYHGQTVRLRRWYFDYDDYKNDPNNLAADEVRRVQHLVKSADIAKRFSGREALIHAVFDLKFPGYGLGSNAAAILQDGSALELYDVEIPQAEQTRYLLFRARGGFYDLVDDFVQPDEPSVGKVAVVGDKFVYSTEAGATVVERAGSLK